MKIQCPVSVKQVAVESGERPKSSSGKGSNGNLLQHLRPLLLVSRLFSLNPFRIIHKSGKEVQISSTLGILQCMAACVGYGAFHLYTTYSDDFDTAEKSKNATRNATDASDSVQEKSEQNFVSVMIDMYNRYSGLGLYWVLVIGAIGNRRILIRFVESLQEVDQIFETKLNVVVNNLHWKRVICIQMTLIFAIIFLFEYFNCIVYLSDYNPSSVYCMPDCYLVLLTEATAESQIVGYIKLLQMRFQLINQLLTRFNESNLPNADREDSTALSSLSKLVPMANVILNPTSSNDTKFELNELEPHHSDGNNPAAANNAFVKEIVPERRTWRMLVPASVQSDQPCFRGKLLGTSAAKTLQRETRFNAIREVVLRFRGNETVNIPHAVDPTVRRRIHIAKKHRKRVVHPTIATKAPLNIINQRAAFVNNITEHWKQTTAGGMNPTGSEAQNHNRMEIINEIKNLYAHLHLLSLNINKAYGVQLVFILMTLFVTLTTLMYHCNMKAIRLLLHRPSLDEDLSERYWEVLSTFFWVALSAYRIFRICNICNATKNEASQIGCLIHGLGMNTNCIRTKTTVKLFSLQLLQQKVEFSACGLLAIDHGLVFNIVGAVTTYILILLQFDVAQNRSQWQRHD